MKILMVNPSLLISEDFIDYPYFVNLGILQNAAIAKISGYSTTVLDFFAQKQSGVFSIENNKILLGHSFKKTILENIESNKFDIAVIGVNAFLRLHTPNPYLKHLIKILKQEKKIPFLILADCYFGGMHYIDYSCETASKYYPEVDYFIKYETEKDLEILLQGIASKNYPENKFWKGHSKDIFLDTLPYPAWELINIEHYFQFLHSLFTKTKRKYPFRTDIKILPLIATRGCKYKCSFCANSLEDNILSYYRNYSLDYIANYIKELKKYDIEGLVFLDNAPNLNKNYFEGMLNILNKESLFYDFPNGLRADKLEKQHLKLMKDKITLLSISAESGNQDVIDNIIKKNQKLERLKTVASWCKELKIPLLIHYVIGFPDETKKEINDTLTHAQKMNEKYAAIPSIQFAVPLPGTKLFSICKEKKMLPTKNPADYSEFFTKKYLITNNSNLEKGIFEKFKQLFELRINTNRTQKIIVNLTYRCNNYCIFCAVGDREKVDANVERVKNKLKLSFEKGIKWLDIDGGEPTLHSELITLIKYARTLGYERINLTTNGRMFYYEDFAKKILSSGICSLLISLHGHNEQVHNVHTRTIDSFNQTVKGIKNVLKYKPDEIDFGINTTITKFNYKYIPEFLNFVRNLGINKLTFQFVTPFGRATKDILPDYKKTIPILKKALNEFGEILKLSIINLPFCYMEGYENYIIGDFLKTERNMLFVTDEEINLANFLASKRMKKDKCLNCVYNIICGGLYEFN